MLDTGRLPQATHDLIDRVRERYDKEVEVLLPRSEDVEAMVRAQGMNLFYESIENRQLCCRIRKVEPLKRYLAGIDAWVSGLRRDQNVTRANTAKLEIDYIHGGIVKVNPIADWTRDQVMAYVQAHNVPINRLHAQGYPSVGCEPVLARGAPGRRRALRPLVVGAARDPRVRDPRAGGAGIRNLISRRGFLVAAAGFALWPLRRGTSPRRCRRRRRAPAARPELAAALEKSPFVYVSPLRADGEREHAATARSGSPGSTARWC